MFRSLLNLVKTEPALVMAVVQAALSLIAGTGLSLTAGQSGAILGATTALLALITAIATRPFRVAALTGFLTAAFTLALAFGVHGIQPGLVAAVNGAVVAIAALVVRGHVSPAASRPPAPPFPA
jgi:hypothetical protein